MVSEVTWDTPSTAALLFGYKGHNEKQQVFHIKDHVAALTAPKSLLGE